MTRHRRFHWVSSVAIVLVFIAEWIMEGHLPL